MRPSVLLLVFALFAPILAVPVPSGKGKNNHRHGHGAGSSKSKSVKKSNPPRQESKPKVAGNPGDVDLVEPVHFIGGDSGGADTTKKPRPAIVVQHEQDTHHVHVVPMSRDHPAGVPTVPAHDLNIPAAPGTLLGLGTPKVIHQDNIKKELAQKLDGEQMDKVHYALAHPNSPIQAPAQELEGNGEEKATRRELEGRSTGWSTPEEYQE